MQVLKIENRVVVMKEIFLSSLKKLLNEIECGEQIDINQHLSDCWNELLLREKDTSFPPEVIAKNKKILEKLTVILHEHKEKPIGEENLHQIKSKLFGEKLEQKVVDEDYLQLKKEISDMSDFLTEIERKMKKGDKLFKE